MVRHGKAGFDFAADSMRNWFKRVRGEFFSVAKRFTDKPILFCEVGCWTGDCSEFTCQKILTHPESRGIGIDDYAADWRRNQAEIDQVKADAVARLAPYPQWSWIFAKSQTALRTWDRGPIDLLFVDGSHNAHDVLLDFCYAWPHLRKGSVVVFDDFAVGHRQTREDGMPRVPEAVAAVESTFRLFVKRLEGTRMQAAFEVVSEPVTGELIYHAPQAAFSRERVR